MNQDRFVALQGCHNFRDLGGYPTDEGRSVRTGVVFRSDGLHELSAEDIEHLRSGIGIRAIIDLRSEAEARSDGPGSLATPPVAYHHVPLLIRAGEMQEPGEGPFELDRFYLGLMQHGASRVRTIIEILAEHDAPVVFHCAAGKDRTGVIAAVVLGLLGVSSDVIAEDYGLTRRGLAQVRARLLRSESYRAMLGDLPRESMHADPATMTRLLERVSERWGSMARYAEFAGIDSTRLAHLRERLLQ